MSNCKKFNITKPELQAMCDEGMSVAMIAEIYGASSNTIRNYIRTYGITRDGIVIQKNNKGNHKYIKCDRNCFAQEGGKCLALNYDELHNTASCTFYKTPEQELEAIKHADELNAQRVDYIDEVM